jgi:hypothetical protein
MRRFPALLTLLCAATGVARHGALLVADDVGGWV